MAKMIPKLLSPEIKSNAERNIVNYAPEVSGHITFSRIKTYKGLENSVIILVDIASYEEHKLLYVGLSRARSALIVFESESAYAERAKRLKN